MTTSETIEKIVVHTLKQNKLEDTANNRIRAMYELHDSWSEHTEPSIHASVMKVALNLAISHLSMRIRLGL